jgi:hypothetical protein
MLFCTYVLIIPERIPSVTKAETLFHKIAKELKSTEEKSFGALCMKVPSGKSGAMFWREDIVVKLDGINLVRALRLKGAKLFDPMGNRPMREWAQIPFEHSKKWKKYAQISFESIKAKK